MIKLSDIEGDDPFQIFTLWYDQAKHSDVDDPTVMHLATCVKSRPSGRIVLLKRFCAEKGFVFFTNYASRKGHEISLNPRVALTFYWDKIDKQVRIEGLAEKIPEHESDEYFSTRPRVKQLGAWASHQSHSFNDLVEFSDRISDVTQQFKDEKIIPRPPTWGGYVVKPTRFEFWLEGEGRLHTRVMFSKKRSKFIREYLYP